MLGGGWRGGGGLHENYSDTTMVLLKLLQLFQPDKPEVLGSPVLPNPAGLQANMAHKVNLSMQWALENDLNMIYKSHNLKPMQNVCVSIFSKPIDI